MSNKKSKKELIAESVVLRNKIIDELIPKLEKAGKREMVARLYVAVEVGEDKVMEWPHYWEHVSALAENTLVVHTFLETQKRILKKWQS